MNKDLAGLALGLALPSVGSVVAATLHDPKSLGGADFDRAILALTTSHVGALVAAGICLFGKGFGSPSLARGAAIGFGIIAASIQANQHVSKKIPILVFGIKS